MVIAMSIVSVIIAVVVPVVLAAYTTRHFKVSWTIVLYGAMAFIVAYFINLVISNQISTLITSGNYPWMNSNWFPFVYAFVLGLLTGLLEQGANWLAFKLSGEMGKTWGSALGLGLGHGGMESIYAVGIPLLLTVIQVINLQANGVESLNLSAADAASVKASLAAFFTTPWHLPLAVGVERVLMLVIQVTAAVLTWLAFRKRGWYWFAAAVGLQLIATSIGTLLSYTGISAWGAEGIIFLLALVSGYILYLVKTRVIDVTPELIAPPAAPAKAADKTVVDGKSEFVPSAPLVSREPSMEKVSTKKSTSKKPAAKKNK